METKIMKVDNYVPARTLLRHTTKELKLAYEKMAQQAMTIKQLQRNIQMLLSTPEVKKEVAAEARIRDYKRQMQALQQKLHQARLDRNEIIEKYAKLQMQLQDESKVA